MLMLLNVNLQIICKLFNFILSKHFSFFVRVVAFKHLFLFILFINKILTRLYFMIEIKEV